MRLELTNPPRTFEVGFDRLGVIHDCGRVELQPDEQVTFTTPRGGEYDVTRREWGFYATPSTNSRLASFGLRTVLTTNRLGRAFVMLVESGHEKTFLAYAEADQLEIVAWLDTDEAVSEFRSNL
jgi:hypothetical protein